LRRRYISLGTGELAAGAVFAAVAVTTVIPRLDDHEDQAALWSALIPLLVVLVQAGAYWLLARGWVERRPMPAALAALYRAFRVADAVLLVVGLVGVLVWLPGRPGAAVAVLATWLFAVVEYLNYFVVRLAYPVGRWLSTVGQWRTPRLVQDVRSARPLTQPQSSRR
jgi:hypothetical protein